MGHHRHYHQHDEHHHHYHQHDEHHHHYHQHDGHHHHYHQHDGRHLFDHCHYHCAVAELGVERENEGGWCIFMYFQDTYFQDVISTKKYIFSRCNLYKEIYILRKGNIQLCSELFQRVHTVFFAKKQLLSFPKN